MGQSASLTGRPDPTLENYRSGGLTQKDRISFVMFFYGPTYTKIVGLGSGPFWQLYLIHPKSRRSIIVSSQLCFCVLWWWLLSWQHVYFLLGVLVVAAGLFFDSRCLFPSLLFRMGLFLWCLFRLWRWFFRGFFLECFIWCRCYKAFVNSFSSFCEFGASCAISA